MGLLNVLTDIVWRLTVEWRAGNVACKVIKFLQVGVTYASTYVLVALSIDRYDAITHPMNFSGSCEHPVPECSLEGPNAPSACPLPLRREESETSGGSCVGLECPLLPAHVLPVRDEDHRRSVGTGTLGERLRGH